MKLGGEEKRAKDESGAPQSEDGAGMVMQPLGRLWQDGKFEASPGYLGKPC
jgi:hypothetical protein